MKNNDQNKTVASIQRQYILIAILLGSFVITASAIGYIDMINKSNDLIKQVKSISSLLEVTAEIRNHIVISNQAIDTFMLEPERVDQKTILNNELIKANVLLQKITPHAVIKNLSVANLLDEIEKGILLLGKESRNLFKIRVDVNAQYPAMEVAANIMRPSRNAIFSSFIISINEFQENSELKKNSEAFDLLIYAQIAWISTIAEFRLYMANRIGSFNEKGLIEQEINVDTYVNQIESIAQQLKVYKDNNMFGFEGSEQIEQLPGHITKWKSGYQRVKEINHSSRWRQDSQLMKDIIVPLLNEINQRLIELDNKIKIENNIVLTKLNDNTINQSVLLVGIILLFIIYMLISIFMLKRFIIKPIALISKTLKNEAFGQAYLNKLNIKKTKETQDLIDAFNEMNHQVNKRQVALESQALNDTLTSLPNRLQLKERLGYHLKIAHREKKTLIFMMLDLNRFKEINDTLGHHIGDRLLIDVGKRLKKVLRDMDTVARLGGDEFAILLPDANKQNAVAIAKKINNLIEAPFKVHSYTLQISVSIGISEFPNDSNDMNTLMQHSDVAMYQSKRNNIGYSFYDPNTDLHSVERLSLGTELRLAIDENKLELYFQPKYELNSGNVIGAEALLRWQHPRMGFISPELIIETAEHMGLINDLTYWIINNAVFECSECNKKGLGFNLAINLSVHNLRDSELYNKINKALKQYQLPNHLLTLEVTESAMMTNPEQSIEVLNVLSKNGINISVDDFGTGFSSLAYLKQLPVSELKIDKSFVIDMEEDKNDEVIVRSTIELGHNLGLRVVAEGVEKRKSWVMLKKMKCDFAQGYYMSRPLDAKSFKQWLKKSITRSL
ncbi:MAG: EAL domain-containing protein [Gammaproteobacteria bacterium]|nr:EAL domain-containing protein [Gammaproteobacteria bacterium]